MCQMEGQIYGFAPPRFCQEGRLPLLAAPVREKGTILKRSTADRPDADREKRKDEKTVIETDCLIEPKALASVQWSNDVTNGQIGQCFSGKIFVDRGGI